MLLNNLVAGYHVTSAICEA